MNNEPNTLFELLEKLKADGVPPEHYGKHYEKFMEFKCRKQGVPKHGHFELTPLCNLDCKMCYVHLPKSSEMLSVEQWKDLMRQAHKAGMLYASLTGGECLTYPGFDELYLFLRSMGVQVNVLSNGILMDAERIEFFKQHPPRTIQVSLYGSCEDAYEAVTGKRVFRKVYDNLMALKEAGLTVNVAITPSRFMADDLRPLIELVERSGMHYSINAGLFPPREETGRQTEDLTDEQYLEMYRFRAELQGKEYVPFDPSELSEPPKRDEEPCGVLCGAGRSGFNIQYNGTMTPCISLDTITAKPLEVGFDAAWREINAAAKRYQRPVECDDCPYAPACLICAAMHKNAPQFGHCDPRICARTKKLMCIDE